VGAGPNGLAAAALLARAGLDVLLLERNPQIGGGLRSAELTLDGFGHDVCSAVHPLAVCSPFLRCLPLEDHGLEWVHPEVPLAHALAPGRSLLLHRSLDETARALGTDAAAYRVLFTPFLDRWEPLVEDLLAPLHPPRHPLLLARFGLAALRSARALLHARFRSPEARALVGGVAAHSVLPLGRPSSAAVGLVLTTAAHAVGWPLPRGGSGRFARALGSYLAALGVEVETGHEVTSLAELPPARAILLDLTPRQVVSLAAGGGQGEGVRLPPGYLGRLERYRYGPGAYKVDWALDGPIPWSDPETSRAGTVHLGGTLEEMVESEAAPWSGRVSEHPYVLLAQPTLWDPARAPAGKHIGWAYCHVPHGFRGDLADVIEARVERFAPGFRDLVLARSVKGPPELEAMNPNLVGGDIGGGVQDLGQLFTRPVTRLDPYTTPDPRVFLCSSSTPPGGGVHGMCGYHAARSALRRVFGLSPDAAGADRSTIDVSKRPRPREARLP
jgi:phytoene dehydrogenase-like protein